MGIEIETFETILEELKQSQLKEFGDKINISNSSNNIRFMFPIMDNLLKKYEQLQSFVDSADVYKAEGLWLDLLLSNFNFIRKQPSQATCIWTTNDSIPNTRISPGDLIIIDDNKRMFANTNSVIININGIGSFNMLSIGTGSEYNILENTTKLLKPIVGIKTGVNSAASGGQDKETDFEFRTRFLAGRAGKSFWNISGIYNELLQLNGVNSVFVEENDLAIPVGELTPHSIRVTVDGGNDIEIANVIFEKADIAIEKIGTTSVTIKDIIGYDRLIKFQRPIEIDIEYKLSVSGVADTPTITTELKNYIDTAGIHSTISTFQAIRHIENMVDLSHVQSIDISFRRSGDITWLTSLTFGTMEKGSGVLVIE